MAKCAKCGRKGLFMRVNKDGLCSKCALVMPVSTPLRVTPARHASGTASDSYDDMLKAHRYQEQIRGKLDHISDAAYNAFCIDDRISAAKEYIRTYDELKAESIKKGPLYEQAFIDENEHLHNSADPDFSWRDTMSHHLEKMESERDFTLEAERLGAEVLDGLGLKIIEILRENDGILQRNLGQKFPQAFRAEVRNLLSQLEKISAIRRVKEGSSYLLYLEKDGKSYTAKLAEPEGDLLPLKTHCPFCEHKQPMYQNSVCFVCRRRAKQASNSSK